MTTVAIVPAYNRADTVGATVRALFDVGAIDRILVVDDGSTDSTGAEARAGGAHVLRLPANVGKGGAVRAAAVASPDADVYLLVDADVGDSAALTGQLLEPVLDGDADMTIAVLPAAGGRGGFGAVVTLARRGVRRACGFDARAPLSGQRAVRASLLRPLMSAERFGLEVGLTVDAVRAGARVVEIELAMDHRHTGRTWRGFLHRARQGSDIVRALWPRLAGATARRAIISGSVVAFLAWMLWSGAAAVPTSAPPSSRPAKVLLVGIPGLSLDDLGTGATPALDRIAATGAVAATSVRTLSARPSTVEAYATLGAGARVKVSPAVGAEQVFPADATIEGSPAGSVVARRTGRVPRGDVVVINGPATVLGSGPDVASRPGALGEALADAGLETGVVGSADIVDPNGTAVVHRPAAVALMDDTASVTTGTVSGNELLVADPLAPYGIRADLDVVVDRTMAALATADVVLVDTGDADRAQQYGALSSPSAAEAARVDAVRSSDRLVGRLLDTVSDDTLVLVVGMTPPTKEWELTPTLAAGAGVRTGYLHSTSTKRLGLITITDLAPTILESLGAPIPDGMIGAPLRYHPGDVSLASLSNQNDHAAARESVYFPMAVTFIVVQALVYLLAILALSQGAAATRIAGPLRFVVVAFAAWPLSTFLYRALPMSADPGPAGQVIVWAITALIGVVALRARRHALSPLAWIAGATVALLVVDVSTGARLQMSSILGYSPHTAARFTGFGNTAFAVLAATTIVAATIHVQFAPRRQDALLTAGGVLLVALVADSAPTLGSDVGGVLTLVPVFGLLAYVLAGRRVSWRTIVVVVVATVATVSLVSAIDLLRPPEARTHLGRFVAEIGSGDSSFLTTIGRKWSTNVELFGKTIWTWMVPITSIFVIYVLVVAKGWQRLLPPRSALRAGVVGTVVAGLIGWLVNDSGVVVSALVFVFVGPFLTLLALRNERGEPVLLPPLSAPAAAAPVAVESRS